MSAKATLKELKMKKQKWLMPGVLGLLAVLWLGVGSAQAAIVMSTSDPGVTLEISQWNSSLMSATPLNENQFPEPGQILQLVLKENGIEVAIDTLTLNPSYHPGTCTNFGSDIGPDFMAVSGNRILSTDCGGSTQITVIDVMNNTYVFNLIQDFDVDGIPDWFEQQSCSTATCLAPEADDDTGPVDGAQQSGDGIANFDEYRGFRVSGNHIRTDPRQKDLFVHIVNPQCGSDSLLGGGTFTFLTGDALRTNLNSLISEAHVHLLNHDPDSNNLFINEWVDRFDHYSLADDTVFQDADGNPLPLRADAPDDDRQININAVHPVAGAMQKGLRMIECVVNDSGTQLGNAGHSSPNGSDNDIIYTNRIANYIDGIIYDCAGCMTTYSTLPQGASKWTSPEPMGRDQLIANMIAYVLAMEFGHSALLTPTLEGSKRTSYGFHHAPGTGTNMDQAIKTKDSNQNGTIFYIPSIFDSGDRSSFLLHY